MQKIFLSFGFLILLMSCNKQYPKGTFGYDLKRLQAIKSIEVLAAGDAMIAVSGTYQGRIFTSSAKGKTGKSYGWVNWDLIAKGEHARAMAGLGGESRLWFAPEWGKYSLCFEAGKEQIDANLRRPQDSNTKQFAPIKRTKNSLTYGGKMQFKNDHDFVFDLEVERTISLLSKAAIEKNLALPLSDKTAFVGFSAETVIENSGTKAFQKETGLIAIWELGCMLTSPDNVIILPLSQATDSITEYFTPTEDNMQIKDKVVYYKGDAQWLNKIGILPQYCENVMGSYSPANQQLNIVTFTFDKEGVFVNSLPKSDAPYKGDVINIFNGEQSDKFNLPFYEFESISSAKELQPKEQIVHQQTTYHFEGTLEELDKIAQQVLGLSLTDLPEF